MSSILENFIYGKSDKHSNIVIFAKTICIAQILFACNACKQKGISILTIFVYYFELIFRKTTVYYTSINSLNSCKKIDKNTIYRLIHNSSILWEKLLSLSAKAVIEIISKLKTKNPIFTLIADETIFERTRSQKTELMSRVFDHNENIFKNGFRLLTLIWCDGNTQIPLFGSLLASKKTKKVLNPAEPTEEGSIEHTRRQNAIKTAPDILIDHLNEVVKLKIPAQYILFDAWFSFPSLIYKIVSNFKFHIVSRLKNNKVKYIYNSQYKTINELYKESKKRR